MQSWIWEQLNTMKSKRVMAINMLEYIYIYIYNIVMS